MAFAVVEAVTEYSATFGTSHDVPLPASIAAGELLIVLVGVDGDSAPAQIGVPGDWTKVAEQDVGVGSDADGGLAWAYKVADGSEGATVTVTSNNEALTAQVYRISGWHGTTPPEGAIATATTANPDPPSLAPSWGAEDTLWLAVQTNNNAGTAVTAFPSNYTDSETTTAGTNAQGQQLASARRELNAASEDPGTFTLAASNPVAVLTIAVRPAAGGGATSILRQMMQHGLFVGRMAA